MVKLMRWFLKSQAPEEFIGQFPEYSRAVLQLLYNRGLKTQKQVDEFFNPDYEQDLHDPFLLSGMKKAVKRVKSAMAKKEKIAVFGDYDADGVCGAIILKSILEELGANLNGLVYIPDRNLEGYGLNIAAVKEMAERGVKLLLTVDCGVSDYSEIKLANSLGIDVIVVDHHQSAKTPPPALAIIDPWQKEDEYPFKELSGAGVAFKLVQALIKDEKEIKPGWEKWLLDLVALATVADLMPLLGENRILVRYGLIVLAQTRRLGLQELMKIARLNPIFEAESLKTNLDSYSLGFILAPRLNAAGRMRHANLAFRLLLTADEEEAVALAKEIDEENRNRQKVTEEIVKEVQARLDGEPLPEESRVIVEFGEDWPAGVVGLAAAKICDRYHRPTFIISGRNAGATKGASKDEEVVRGSARSIPALDLVEAIGQCAQLLREFGGHRGAAGLALERKNIDHFRKKINQVAREKLTEADLTPILEIDFEILAEYLNWDLYDQLEKFEPFGRGNEKPIFLIKGLEVGSWRLVGNGAKHLKLELKAGNPQSKIFKAIGFGMGKNGSPELAAGQKVDVVFEILIDEWNGERELQMKIVDLHAN